MARGETVKYVIDADTSGFARGMAEAAAQSGIAGRQIDRNLNRTAKNSENNFNDIRRNASTAANQIRNFGVAMQGFNVTTAILGVTALSGAIIELSAAISAAGSTMLVLPGILMQAVAGVQSFKTGVFGLDDAFKAINKNDPKAFAESLANLGPAATKFAYAYGGLNKAFNGVRLNTQQALLSGLSDVILHLGAVILPTLNAGMQIVARSMNEAFKSAAKLGETPMFQGLLATVFSDTARSISILSQALDPLLTIFTNLYMITRPYIFLLSEGIVSLAKSTAGYLSSARGQMALNIAIQQGIIALKELGSLVGAVFGLLTSLFRTSVNAGNSLLPTLTNIINRMEAWVNSARGQQQLIALFNFTSLALEAFATTVGRALQLVFGLVDAFSSLNPALQQFIVSALASSFLTRYLFGYISKLYLSIRVLAVALFNVVEQAIVVFGALGAVSSVVLVLAGALIVLGAIIRGPLGAAFIIVGTALAAYVGLTYLAAFASRTASTAFWQQGVAAMQLSAASAQTAGVNVLLATTMYNVATAAIGAGAGMSFAARAAAFLRAAIIPIIVAATALVVILSMLGVFGSSSKKGKKATDGFSSSLGSLQKAMKGVGGAGNQASTGGLSALNDSLNQVGESAEETTGSLAAFDKMNVLSDDKSAGAGAGIPGLPSLPDVGNQSLGAPTLDTSEFDKAIEDMQKNFEGLNADIGAGFENPFAALGEWINEHPWISLAIFGVALVAIIAIIIVVGATIGLIVAAIGLVIAIGILLWKNWDAIWEGIKTGASIAWQFLQKVWDGILNGAKAVASGIASFFKLAWDGLVLIWNLAVAFFQGIFDNIIGGATLFVELLIGVFRFAWDGIVIIWNAASGYFAGVWNNIKNAFAVVGSWFSNIFSGAWNNIKNAFSGVGSFFQGIWNTIVSIFGRVGTSIGDAISGSVKSVINAVLNTVSNIVNNVINTINGAIRLINKLPGVSVGTIGGISLPRLAQGGVVTEPTFAQIGEAGAEAVMPLENNTEWIDQLASKINGKNGTQGSTTSDIIPVTNKKESNTPNITIQVSGVFATSVAEQKKVADVIAKQLNDKLKAKGMQGVF